MTRSPGRTVPADAAIAGAVQPGGTASTRTDPTAETLPAARAEALRVAREQWRHAAITGSLWDIEQPEDFDARAGDPTDEQLRQGAIVSADPGEVADRIAAAVAIGFDRVYLHGIGTDQSAFLDRAERDLLPALRRAL